MISRLIHWSLHNRAAVILVALIFTGLGVYTTATMPVDVFPDLTAPTVTVLTEAHGMAPAEVENLVTFPIETALNGASGVRRVRSSTAVGISVVWAEFDWGTDIYTARQIVGEKVALVSNDLPPQVERPILAPISSIMGEIMFIAVTSDRHSTIELRTVADTILRRRLLSVPGVAQVTPTGGDVKQYQIVLDPEQLAAYEVTIPQVLEAVEVANENVSAGFMNQSGSEYLVSGIGRVQELEDIGETVMRAVKGVPIRVADLGEVRIGAAPKRGEGSANAQPAVVIGIQKQPEANTLTLTQELDRVLDEIQADLPDGMVIERNLFRQANFIEVAVENVEEALLDGAILVVVIMFFFLMNVRATLITLTAIPLSLLAAILAIKGMGGTINTMTLGGMAIAIGSLVDDAVIDVENVVRRLRENMRLPKEERKSSLRIVYDASVEIQSSIVFATFIIALVFLPIFFLTGVEGRLMQPLATAYVVALFSSLLIALTVTPVLCHLILPGSKALQQGKEPRFSVFLKKAYDRVLAPVLRHPWVVTVPVIILFVIATVGFLRLGRSFLPEFNEGSLTISAVTLPGTSLPESDQLGRLVE